METHLTDQPGPGMLIAERYEVLSQLGTGTSGIVFKVRDRVLETSCALKLLHQERERGTAHERLLREMRVLSRLNHESIVRVYDIGINEADARRFVTMELVDGVSLRELVARSPDGLPFAQALPLLLQIAQGMAAAHKQQIVHRDLKPENLLVSSAGKVKIVDFGLARSAQPQAALTTTGELVGTPSYMAPEQVRGKAADERSDIYSFGIVAYELLTGSCPFTGSNLFETIGQHLFGTIPPLPYRSDTPSWVQSFLEKCTSKDPLARFSSFEEIAELLESAANPSRRRRLRAAHFLSWKELITYPIVRAARRMRRSERIQVVLLVVAINLVVFAKISGIHVLLFKPIYKLERTTGAHLAPLHWWLRIPYPPDEKALFTMLYDPSRFSRSGLAALLSAGVDPNAVLKPGYLKPYAHSCYDGDPIIICAARHDQRSLRLLVDAGADLRRTTPRGVTALDAAVRAQGIASTRYLVGSPKIRPFVNPNSVPTDGLPPLVYTAGYHPESVAYNLLDALLTLQPNLDLEITDLQNATALERAALSNKKQIVRRLLDAGARPYSKRYGVWISSLDVTPQVRRMLKAHERR